MKKDILKQTPNSPMAKAAQLIELEIIFKDLKEKIAGYKAELLETTQQLDVITLKTGKYTISRCKRTTSKVVDFNRLKKELDKAEIPYVTEEVFGEQMNLVFKKLAEDKREFDGLEVNETEYITVRVAKEKGEDIK